MDTHHKFGARTIGALAISTLALTTHADVKINGFMTVGGGIADPDEGDTLAGYEDSATFDNETVLGIQLSAPLGEKLSATGQLVSRGEDDFEVEAAWAYVAYEASEAVTLRLGRFRTPYYLYSDFLEVGYAYHWISPPSDLYSLPTDSIDGVDVIYTTELGSTDFTAQAYFGSTEADLTISGAPLRAEVRDQWGLAFTFEYDWFLVRASHHESDKVAFQDFQTIALPDPLGSIGGLAATWEMIDPSVARSLREEDIKFTYDELAFKVDWNNFLVVLEASKLESEDSIFGETNRRYGSFGYTFGSVMLHYTLSETDDDAYTVSTSVPSNATVAGLTAATDALAASVVSPSRTTNTIGLRWDFEPGAAFKFEASDIDDDTGTSGNLYRFAVDLVF